MNNYEVLVRPIVTEKAVAVKEGTKTLVFQVSPNANKTEIKQAV